MAEWSTVSVCTMYASLHHVIETRHACGAELSGLDFEYSIHSTMEAGQKPTSNRLDVDIWSTRENLAPIRKRQSYYRNIILRPAIENHHLVSA